MVPVPEGTPCPPEREDTPAVPDDLVERLRDKRRYTAHHAYTLGPRGAGRLHLEAAARIEADHATIAALEERLARETALHDTAVLYRNYYAEERKKAQAALAQKDAALKQIEGGSFDTAVPLILAGDWRGFTTELQAIARAALRGTEG
ncbi:MAG: hypothetical protein ACAH27_06035 [Xanthobacteraceae bacterium]